MQKLTSQKLKNTPNTEFSNSFSSKTIITNASSKASDNELRMTKIETILSILSNQNDLLAKKIEELEKEKNNCKNSERNSINKSISTEVNSFNDVNNEFFNNTQNTIELEDWKKDIENSIEKLSEKITKEKNEKLINNLEKKIDEQNFDILNMKNIIVNLENKNENFEKKFDKFSNLEKLISELINQINNMKNHNNSWQANFLKNMNDFNEKIMNQEILLDQLDKFEKLTNKKIEIICHELKKIPNNLNKQITQLLEKFDLFEKNNFDYNNSNIQKEKNLNEQITKIDLNIKALWDSFTFFSHSLNN